MKNGAAGAREPELLFRWKKLDGSPWPKWCAVGATALMFAAMFAVLRVETPAPPVALERKVSALYLSEDGVGRPWVLLARELGPAPLRFDPQGWEGFAALEAGSLGPLRAARVHHRPMLLPFPETSASPAPPPLLPPGLMTLPALEAARLPAVDPGRVAALRSVPLLYPLSDIPREALPSELPPFEGEVDARMSATTWRFLLRLDEHGGVLHCVSLTGGEAPGTLRLERWMRGLSFDPALAAERPWIAVALTFGNERSE